MHLHLRRHVSFEGLSRMPGGLFGLTFSDGAISNAFRDMGQDTDVARKAIQAKLLTAKIIGSDETTTRAGGATHWQWVFLSDNKIAPSRARYVADEIPTEHKPHRWNSDRHAGQQELGTSHQVCLPHVLLDVKHVIDRGDTTFAPKIRDHLRWAIGAGKQRSQLKDAIPAAYAAKADNRLRHLVAAPVARSPRREPTP
jgi:transposase